VVIGPSLLLTGAHVVANATFLQVQKPSQPDKAIARVRAVSHDSDLALLEVVEPPNFLSDIQPAELGPMPHLRDQVAVVGYPVGGEEISITEGVVSRIEVQRYSHSQRHLLAVTVDAAINAGNSGGPVFGNNKVVGIAFQKLTGVDNIGEMVPPPIIRAFLDGVEAGRRPEIPALGITTQNLENPLLRKQLGLADHERGVAVLHVDYSGSADGVLEPRDVITAIDGLPIANNGTVQHMGHTRTRYDVVLGHRYIGDRIELQIKRNGAARVVELELKPWMPLVPRSRYDQAPAYFVYGGLVFQTLTRDYLTTWDKWWNKAPKEFLNYYYLGYRSAEQHEVVILTQILADLDALSATELLDLMLVARAIGHSPTPETLEGTISPRGFRLLAKVPRLPATVVDRLVEHFGGLQKLLAATVDDLQAVDGVGETRARSVREGLSRLAESSILERYV